MATDSIPLLSAADVGGGCCGSVGSLKATADVPLMPPTAAPGKLRLGVIGMHSGIVRHLTPLLPFDLIALQHALLVEEHGSVRSAAQLLGVRPSVVSRRLRGLEDAIGVSLFHRTSRGVQTTTAGVQVFEQGRAILADIERLKHNAGLSGKGAEGRLRFGAVASMGAGIVRELLGRFKEAQPNVEIEILGGGARDSLAALRRLALDFALVAGKPLAPACVVEALWHERLLVALPDTHPLAAHEQVGWAQLVGERFIVSRQEPGPEIEAHIAGALAGLGQPGRVERVAAQREMLLTLVGLDTALGVVGQSAACAAPPGVTFRRLGQERIPLSLVWSAQNDNPAFRRFLSGARAHALACRSELPATSSRVLGTTGLP